MTYDHLEQFEHSLAMRDLSANTLKAYIRDLRLFAKWFESTNRDRFTPPAITPIDLREYKSYLLTVQEAKPATINRKLSSISAFCRWSVEQGLIDTDPSQHISQVSEVTLAPKWLTKKEQYALIRSAQKENNARNLALIMVLLHAGLRVSEVSDLRLYDVKISERKGSITVRRGKGTKYRVVPLNADVRAALSAYLNESPQVDHDYVFVGKRGEKLKPWGIKYLVGKYALLMAAVWTTLPLTLSVTLVVRTSLTLACPWIRWPPSWGTRTSILPGFTLLRASRTCRRLSTGSLWVISALSQS